MILAKCVCVGDVERVALEKLPKSIRGYYESGADDECTLARNKSALARYVILPRALCDVSHLNPSIRIRLSASNQPFSSSYAPGKDVQVFDRTMPFPLAIAPTAFHKMCHPDGEIATVKAAGETDTLMICSTLSTTSLEDIAKNAPKNTARWFQLYVYKDRHLTETLVKRAINSGFAALVLTVDTPTFGRRRADERNGFELPSHLRMANFDEKVFSETHQGETGSSGLAKYSLSLFDASLDWSDLEWLVKLSSIPVIVKGIMRIDDAEKALSAGADGIIVSNHGGRQLDHCAATIEALPDIIRVVNGRCPVFMDGGIRSGADIFKAIAMGADTVFVGRPIIYGLAVDGKEGVKHVLHLLRTEFEYAMRLSVFGLCPV